MIHEEYDLPAGYTITVEDGSEVKKGGVLASLEDASITAQNAGRVRVEQTDDEENEKVVVSYEVSQEEEYEIPSNARLLVNSGDHVEPGQALTEGSLNPHLIMRIQGREECQSYLLSEVQKVYRSQGQNINDKHFEVIIRKMMSKVQITRPGDTEFLPGDLVDYLELKRENERHLGEDLRPARYMEILLGITKASLSTESFLSASSFQHTIKVLAQAAIAASEDNLYGLKENVIIGKLIPAGTGFVPGRFTEGELEEALQEDEVVEEKILAEAISEEGVGTTPPPIAAD
jgi:DNA-directed RNA polymerase subunit beta'